MNSNFQKETVRKTILQYFQSPPALSRRILTDWDRWSPEDARKTEVGGVLCHLMMRDAEALLPLDCCERIQEGKRLLGISRQVLYRINTLLMVWKLTGKEEYARRGIREMMAVSAFSDWNPSHFLDVGEMAMALAVGAAAWDNLMTEQERRTVADALWQKAVLPSLPEHLAKGVLPADESKQFLWWIDAVNNWSPVCHAGVIAAALIAGERDPETAAKVIARAVENLPVSMKASYAPNGAYPEGPGYWAYGTDFNCLCLGLLNNAFGTDFGLSELPGWSTTGKYLAAALAPSGMPYNYADGRESYAIGFAWFFLEAQYPGSIPLPPVFLEKLRRKALDGAPLQDLEHGRLLPLAMLYLTTGGIPAKAPLAYYSGEESTMPLAIFRSSTEDDCVYFGIKGGGPRAPHGHMDSGSFILETDQIRWAVDLGMESYHALEERGFSLWAHHQESDRWRVFRIGPESHNILRINGEPQLVDGWGKVTEITENSVRLDLSDLYREAAQYIRTARIGENAVVIQDHLAGVPAGAVIRFQFCTRAAVEFRDGGVILRQDGKSLQVIADGVCWESAPASRWMQEWDSDNGTAQMVWFEVTAPETGTVDWTVSFQKGEIK